MKIVIGINSLVTTRYQAYSNHIQFFFRLGKWCQREGHEIILVNPERMSIDRMRNMAAEIALQSEADYLLFIDDDVLILPTAVQDLIKCNADIAAGDVIIRGYPFLHMVFHHPANEDGTLDRAGLVAYDKYPEGHDRYLTGDDVRAVGFSLCLIRTSLLKKIRKPFFITGPTNTEDIYFCLKVHEAFPDATFCVDTELKCGHILWDEVIHPDNMDNFKIYYESQYPDATKKKVEDHGDRGDEYADMVDQQFGDASNGG